MISYAGDTVQFEDMGSDHAATAFAPLTGRCLKHPDPLCRSRSFEPYADIHLTNGWDTDIKNVSKGTSSPKMTVLFTESWEITISSTGNVILYDAVFCRAEITGHERGLS